MSVSVTRCLNSVFFLRSHPILSSVVVKFPAIQRPSCDVYRSECCSWCYSRKPHFFVKSLHISTVNNIQVNQPKYGKDKGDELQPKVQDQGNPVGPPPANISLFQRFKQMYKDYWYVLIPVHVATSAIWAGGFYFAVKNGLDVVHLLENLGISEKIISPLRTSSVGYYALTYALYKVASPARYAVTIGGTTLSINYLTRWGYIKPASTKKMQVFYENRKAEFDKRRDDIRRKFRQHRTDFKKRINFSRKRVKK